MPVNSIHVMEFSTVKNDLQPHTMLWMNLTNAMSRGKARYKEYLLNYSI